VVKYAEKERILADYYHERTKHSRLSVMGKSGGLEWSSQPKVFKEYSDAEVVELPKPLSGAGMSIGAAIEACRRPVRGLGQDAVSLRDLSTLLYMTNGVTGELRYPGITYYLRAAPSAGALYPIVTYVLVRNVSDLPPGLYHYAVSGHKLHRLRGGHALNKDLAALVAHGDFVENAPVTLIFTAIYFRSSWKYGERAYRYCLLDAGHLAVQTMLAARGLGYRSKLIGRFDDSKVNAFLTVDEEQEGTLLILPVGKPSQQPTASVGGIAFVAQPKNIPGEDNPLLLLMHGRTYFGLAGGEVGAFAPRKADDKSYPDLPVIRLPREFPEGDDIVPTILRRRSARNWANRGMTIGQLASVIYHALGISEQKEGSFPDPSIEDNHALNLYLLVNDVRGLDPGIYYYRRHDHALSRIRKGEYRTKSYAMSLFQKVVGDSGVAIIMTIGLERLGYPDADRGYRYAALDAGMLGGRFYLQSVGLGLGCTGIGAFFDDEVSGVIDVGPDKELVIYMAAIGVKAPGAEK
jgi:SagB-type dehydrogenase family enzyme